MTDYMIKDLNLNRNNILRKSMRKKLRFSAGVFLILLILPVVYLQVRIFWEATVVDSMKPLERSKTSEFEELYLDLETRGEQLQRYESIQTEIYGGVDLDIVRDILNYGNILLVELSIGEDLHIKGVSQSKEAILDYENKLGKIEKLEDIHIKTIEAGKTGYSFNIYGKLGDGSSE